MPNKSLRIFIASLHEKSTDVGAAGSDFCLGKALEKRGHEVDLFFYDDAFPSKRIRGYWKQLFFPWVLARAFLKKHAQKPYDILDCGAGGLWVTDLLLSLLKKMQRPLLSSRIRFMDPLYVEWEKKLENRRLRRRFQIYHSRYFLWEFFRDCKVSDLIIVLSRLNAMYFAEKMKFPDEKIYVIPNGIEDYFLENAHCKSFEKDELFNVMYLGRWQWIKGIRMIPEVISQLFEKDERFRLTCAGVLVSEKEVLQDFPDRYRHRVTVIPSFKNAALPKLMENHGILISPSYAESYSRALLEGMACGLIVVATPVGGAPELIQSGINGFLVEIGDVTGFVKTIHHIVSQPDLMKDISNRAVALTKDFTWMNFAKNCEEAYFEKLARKN